MHCAYAPFSALLQHAAVIVYNGGIGTCGQALRAGVPHLCIPSQFDQPDNAARVVALGLGESLSLRSACRERAIRGALQRLLVASSPTRGHCLKVAERFKAEDGAKESGGSGLAACAALVIGAMQTLEEAAGVTHELAAASSPRIPQSLLEDH